MFISFEGGEAVGKTSLCKLVSAKLIADKYDVLLTREPGGTDIGEALRLLLQQQPTIGITRLLLILAARREHLEKVIAPAIRAEKIVLCDRFDLSTYAYQGLIEKIDLNYIKELSAIILKPFQDIKPDITFLITGNEDLLSTRLSLRDNNEKESKLYGNINKQKSKIIHDAFESLVNEHKRYINLFGDRKLIVINNTKEIDIIAEEIKQEIKILL